jgi:hypothetical protein
MPLVDLRVRHLCALLLGCWAANKLPLRLHPEDRDNQEKKETYMSKNLTRKGLALAAIAALGVSVFAGAPAQASTPTSTTKIATSANKGTTLNTLEGASFALKTNLDPTLKTIDGKDLSKLAYQVTNASGAAVSLASAGASAGSLFAYSSADAVADLAAPASTNGSTSTSTTGYSTHKAFYVKNLAGSNTSDSVDVGSNVLTITSTSDATDAYDVTVQAYIDSNSDGVITDFEYVGAPVTVHFIPVASAVVTTSIKSAVLGATLIQGKVVIGGDVNMANLGNQVSVGFLRDGATSQVNKGAGSVDTIDASYDANETGLINQYGTTVAIDTHVYSVQAYLGSKKLGSASNTVSTAVGTAASVDGTDALVSTATANVISSKDTTDYASTRSSATASTTTVRSGTTSAITFTSKLKSADGTDVKLSGQTVKVTLTKVALAAASTFAAGGVTLTATSGSVSFTTTTDASGVVSFTGAGTGVKADSVAVKIEVLGTTGYKAADVNTVTWADAAATTFVNTNLVGATPLLKIAAGASTTLNYVLADQFGQAVTAGTYRATIVANNASGANPAFTYYTTGVAGVFSQAVVDNSTAAGTYDIVATLQKYNTATAAWDSTAFTKTVNVVENSKAAAAVSASASSSVAVATITKTLVTADLRVDNNSQTATSIGYGTATQTITGTVTDATGAAVSGAVVTVTGAGLGFVVNGTVYTVGSATINTGTDGAYSVAVYSTTAGKTSVVVTSGAATKTAAIEFSGVTAQAETNVLSLDVASLSQVGRSVTVTVKVVDKFGNAVSGIAAAVSVTGVGSLSAATATTGTAGTATVQFVAGANDFGDAVITAKYTATDSAATVVSATKTLTVGVTDAQVDVVNNRVTAVASFSKGKTVGFYVDGVKKWSKLSASDADVVVNYNLKKGRHTVTVKISGGFVTTEVIVVK